jgi:hypothetical protein
MLEGASFFLCSLYLVLLLLLQRGQPASLSCVRAAAGIGEGRYKQQMVDVGDGQQISTLTAGRGSPLVIMHGFASGIGLFVWCVRQCHRTRTTAHSAQHA